MRKKIKMTTLERSIHTRERGIARMKENIDKIQERANEDIKSIEKRIKTARVLLEALKRGEL